VYSRYTGPFAIVHFTQRLQRAHLISCDGLILVGSSLANCLRFSALRKPWIEYKAVRDAHRSHKLLRLLLTVRSTSTSSLLDPACSINARGPRFDSRDRFANWSYVPRSRPPIRNSKGQLSPAKSDSDNSFLMASNTEAEAGLYTPRYS
jgi:hypothetical protein